VVILRNANGIVGENMNSFVIFKQVVHVVTTGLRTETDYTVLRFCIITVLFSANLVITICNICGSAQR
jgi:hypothetical protein